MKWYAITVALAVAALLMIRPSPADAQPDVTYLFPTDGDVLTEPPTVIRMCFARPLRFQDIGDFNFAVMKPDGLGLALRIVFQRDGLGVDIHTGIREDALTGEWLFEWQVTDAETLEPATGSVSFEVSHDGGRNVEVPQGRCIAGTSPATADGQDTDGGGPGPLSTSLITAASVIGIATIGLIVYLIRRRVRSSLHRRPGPVDRQEH